MPSINVLNELQIKQNGVTTTYKLGTVNGYYNTVDGKFYQESTYVTEIAGAPNLVYADIGGNNLYIWKASTSSFVKVSGEGGSSADNLKFGYLKEANGKFYEDSSYTVEIPGDDENLFITLDTNFIYRYDTTNTEFIQIGGGSGAETIKYVNTLPTTDIEDIIYGIVSRISYSETVADNFLDTNNLFEKTEEGDDYTYTAKDGIEIEASTNDTTYKAFESLAFSDSDSEFTLTYGDTSTSTLVNGNTFYFKQVNRNYYAGNEEEQNVTPFASGGGSGEGATYVPGEGVNINNNVISLSPATSSTLGGVKTDNSTIVADANGTISGNYQAGFNVDIDGNTIKTKEFVGTTAEWNSLTAAQKAQYTFTMFSDDFSPVDATPGHGIADSTGAEKTQRDTLQFGNEMEVTDDSTNEVTKVNAIPYTAGDKIDITNHEISVDGTLVPSTFTGTQAEWDALTTAEKAEYEIVNITDDVANGGMVVVDTVEDGNLNAVTSNAVYEAIQDGDGGTIEGYYNSEDGKFYEESTFTTEISGEAGKIYVDKAANIIYRWSGSAFVVIGSDLALGETSTTAYRGDRGKIAYDHSQLTTGNPHNVTKEDVGLGNVGNFKAVSTVANQGLTNEEKANARTNIGVKDSVLNKFITKETLPYGLFYGSAVVYNNEIHILGGNGGSKKHYKWDGTSWVLASTLPYDFSQGAAVVYNNEIHVLGGNASSSTKHYKWNGSEWTSVSTLPYTLVGGSAVVYNNEIHILGGLGSSGTKHYKWNGTSWASVSTLPYSFYRGSAVVYNNEIHILGSNNNATKHYKWNGTSWASVSTLPYNFVSSPAVIYNNEIHILGSGTKYYKWNGTSWASVSTLPYDFSSGSAVVYNNEIHILGGGSSQTKHSVYYINMEYSTLPYDFYEGSAVVCDNEIHILGGAGNNRTEHYKWDGTEWTSVSTLPDYFWEGSAVVYNNEIHILGGENFMGFGRTKHYKWNGTSWSEVSTLPYDFCYGSAVVYNNEIHILGGEYSTKHYKWNGTSWSEVSTLPYSFYKGSAVVYNNEIHLLGGNNGNKTEHYKWDGTSWSEVSTLPYNFYEGSAVVYSNEIHILGSDTKHYKWNGTSWFEVSTLPYSFSNGSAVIYSNEIHILGGMGGSKHYSINLQNLVFIITALKPYILT